MVLVLVLVIDTYPSLGYCRRLVETLSFFVSTMFIIFLSCFSLGRLLLGDIFPCLLNSLWVESLSFPGLSNQLHCST